MKCRKHPDCDVLTGRTICFICQDWTDSYAVESDRNKFEREQMAQHVEPGVRGVRTQGQYQRLLKRHGLTDDLPMREIAACAVDVAKRERVRDAGIQHIVSHLEQRMRSAQDRPVQTQFQHRLKQRVERLLTR
jgi:hypothetical protein